MTKTEALLHRLLDQEGGDIRPLACAVDVMAERMFRDKMDFDDIHLNCHVYPEAARRRGRTEEAVSRSAQRMARNCWDKGNLDVLEEILGFRPRRPPLPKGEMALPVKPKRVMMYLASYTYLGVPYLEAMKDYPQRFG